VRAIKSDPTGWIPDEEFERILEALEALLGNEIVGSFDEYAAEAAGKLEDMGVTDAYAKLTHVFRLSFDGEGVEKWENDTLGMALARMLESVMIVRRFQSIQVKITSFQSDDGGAVEVERVFPLYGYEFRKGLDSREKAEVHYRKELKARCL